MYYSENEYMGSRITAAHCFNVQLHFGQYQCCAFDFLFNHQLFFMVFLKRRICIVSPARNKTSNTLSEFRRMGEAGPSAKGCPIGNRVKVSLTPGINERKTVADIQNNTMYKRIVFFFRPNKYAIPNKRSIKIPRA